MTAHQKAIVLANRAIESPSILNELSEETHFKFVMGIAVFDIELAKEVEALRPFTTSQNKILFWEAVGILMPQESLS